MTSPPTALADSPVIAVVGAGAIGAYYGARLAQHGNAVHFLLRSDFDIVRQRGWTIKSTDGDFEISAGSAHFHRRAEEMPQADLVIVALKTTSNDQLAALISPLLKPGTAILTLQNGLGNEEQLATLFGPQRILGGVAFVCINRGEPGIIHHTAHGLIRLGEFDSSMGVWRAEQIAALFRESGVRCEAVGDLLTIRWQKLVWNIPFNGLGAVMDLTTDRLIATAAGTGLVENLMTEVIAIAKAEGVTMPDGMVSKQISNTREMGPYRTSMQIDRQQNRPLEVEAILGEPLRRGQAKGIKTPILEMVYHFAKVL